MGAVQPKRRIPAVGARLTLPPEAGARPVAPPSLGLTSPFDQALWGDVSDDDDDGAGPGRFVLTLWTNDPAVAAAADAAGVDRIGLDLETYGKAARQPGHLATWISPHSEDQLPGLRRALVRADLFCRVNPINPGSADEVERLVGHGVRVMMLPMFTTAGEVETFIRLVGGRAHCVLLMENKTAADRIEEIVRVPGVREVHVGLNDLTLSLGRPNANRFEVLGSDLMKRVSDVVLGAGIRFGVGGIGRPGNDGQAIPSDLIYAQYPRLGATAALVARSFLATRPGDPPLDLPAEVRRARRRMAYWAGQPAEVLEAARRELLAKTREATW